MGADACPERSRMGADFVFLSNKCVTAFELKVVS
jgi:hypothetical protein